MLFCRFPWVLHVDMVSNFYRETSGTPRAGVAFRRWCNEVLKGVNVSCACSSMT